MRPSPRQRHHAAKARHSTKAQRARKRRAVEQDNYVPTCIASLVTHLWCDKHEHPWPERARTCDGVA